MKRVVKKKRISPRLPVGVAMRLGTHPVTTKKGEKGFNREQLREETQRLISEEILPEV